MIESPHSLKNRMIRAAKLEVDLYEEVEADTGATGQAFQVVLLASIASGLGIALASGEAWGVFLGLISALFGWIAWAITAYWLGTTIFKGPYTSATPGELLRTIGFSNSPMVLAFFVFIPFIGLLIFSVVSIWTLVAGVIAVRQALDFSTWRAIGTCIVGWFIYRLFVSLVVGLVS